MANKLMAPGPVPISPLVLSKFAEPIIHHRTPEFEKLLAVTLKQLKNVFSTEQPVLIIPGTGSAAMEASLVNTLSQGDKVLSLVSGKFGQRWMDMAKNYKLEVHKLESVWGEPIDIQTVSEELKKNNYKAVLCQGVETSTGTLNPISQLSQLIKKINPETLFLVDGITSVGVSDINMSIEGLDVLIAGSQKAFMLPTGLSFISLSKLAWKNYGTSNLPKYYFDLGPENLSNSKNQTRFSSLVSHIKALNFVLKEFNNNKLLERINYTKNCSQAFRTAIKELGLELLSDSPAPSLTAIIVPKNVDGLLIRKTIEEKFNITVMGGQEQLKGHIIRVGHMGFINKQDYIKTLTAIKDSLSIQNHIIDQATFDKAISNFKLNMGKDYSEYFSY